MRRIIPLLAVAFISIHGVACGQDVQETQSVFSDYLNTPASSGFLHVPGLSFQSSVGFSYYSSGAYGSQGMGYYMGHFRYRLGSDWTLNWDVGIGTSMSGTGYGENPQLFIPNLDLTYRPNDRFMFRLQYNQYRYPMHHMGFRR